MANEKKNEKVEKKVNVFKLDDLLNGKVTVDLSRSRYGTTSGLSMLIREKARKVLEKSGDAIRVGEFVSMIKSEHKEYKDYREIYNRVRQMFNTKTGEFKIVDVPIQGKDVKYLVRK